MIGSLICSFVLQQNKLQISSPRHSLSISFTFCGIVLEWRTQLLSNYLFFLFSFDYIVFWGGGGLSHEVFPLSSILVQVALYFGWPLALVSRAHFLFFPIMVFRGCWRYYTPRTFITDTCRNLVREFTDMQGFNIGIFTRLAPLTVHACMGLHARSFLHDLIPNLLLLSLHNCLVLPGTCYGTTSKILSAWFTHLFAPPFTPKLAISLRNLL